MSKRLAITIAGAVSLGSYEAGVLYEVLDALGQHNLDPLTPQPEQIHIDVLTGASAGGMTAIILAQKLLYSADQFVGPYENPLYDAWVKGIDLKGLQNTQPDESALLSLYSSDLIIKISQDTLLSRWASVPVPPARRHPASATALRLGLALTNLNGVDYGYPVKTYPSTHGSNFVYTKFTDQMTRIIDPANVLVDPTRYLADSPQFWEPLRQAAVACGAFPLAFRPQQIMRSAAAVEGQPSDYPPTAPDGNREPWPEDPRPFTYSDGGILQNQPLGIAKNLVDPLDHHLDQENRFYLFVSPQEKPSDTADSFTADNANYLNLLSRLLGVYLGQAGYQDWITADTLNGRIDLLDTRARELAAAIAGNELDVVCLRSAATSLLNLLFEIPKYPLGQHTPPGAIEPETLDQARTRIALQYATEITSLDGAFGAGSIQSVSFRDVVLTFETAAGLGARDIMTIYAITATRDELAGEPLAAFLGFFDQTLRDHDYDVGRSHAREFLNLAPAPAPDSPGIGPIRYDPTLHPIRAIDPALGQATFSTLPQADRDQFHAGTKARVKQMLKELLESWSLPADLAVDTLLDPVLDKVLSRL